MPARSQRSPSRSQFENRAAREGYERIAGVDEVGRGCVFGPVFAAAVVLPVARPIRGLRDSKQLTAERRQALAAQIRERATAWAIASVDAVEIDRINILRASMLAMKRAVEALAPACDYLFSDALRLDVVVPQTPLIHGDARCSSIAAASILAKVERDACLDAWDGVFPAYGLAKNKGYFTEDHRRALRQHGPTPLHRFSFEPVRLNCPAELSTGFPRQLQMFGPIGAAACR